MSYHQTGLGALKCIKYGPPVKGGSLPCVKYACGADEVMLATKGGYICTKTGGSTVQPASPVPPAAPEAAPVPARVAPSGKPGSDTQWQPRAGAVAIATSLAPNSLVKWTTYSKAEPTTVDQSPQVDAATEETDQQAGLGWLIPWALGAVGVGVVIYLVRK